MQIHKPQLMQCLDVMNKLKSHKISCFFFKPIDHIIDISSEDFSQKITKFIDLSIIQNNLKDGLYKTINEWKNDVDIVFDNFFHIFQPVDVEYIIAKKLKKEFNRLINSMIKKNTSNFEEELNNLEEKCSSLLKNIDYSKLNAYLDQNESEEPTIYYYPMSSIEPFKFTNPLVEGVIKSRLSQFTMLVTYNGNDYKCHCPTTGRVGTFDIKGRPCLLSPSLDSSRKTLFTVEAISLNRPRDQNKTWIGINQIAVNRYVEHFLVNGGFSDMISNEKGVLREQTLGSSKLDFLVGNTYLEVKMPLQQLQIDIPEYVSMKKCSPFSATDRMTRHITELGNSLGNHQRAILLTCFVYDNPGFKVIEKSTNYDKVKQIVDENIEKGVETWQANFKIDSSEVTLEKYFKVDIK